MKFALISPVLPPSPSGQAVVLYKLLKGINPEKFIAISTHNYQKKCRNQCTERLDCDYIFLPDLNIFFKKFVLITNFLGVTCFLHAYLQKRAADYVKIFKQTGCQKAIACTANLFEPYAVFLACKTINIPFYFYIFDDYILQWTNPSELKFVKETGNLLIKNAKIVVVANECLKKEYNLRYNIESEVIHNPVNLADYTFSQNYELTKSNIRIVYTGDVGEAHYDAFRDLIFALEQLHREDVEFHIYTSRRKARLLKEGIGGPFVVLHPHQNIASIPEIQQSADILFLPLAFHSKYPDFIINSASPGKMGELLAAGRPILVHAPSKSYVTWYFKKNKCGIVVDSPHVEELANAIQKLVIDENLRRTLSEAARKSARQDFNLDSIRSHFKKIIYDEAFQ